MPNVTKINKTMQAKILSRKLLVQRGEMLAKKVKSKTSSKG